MQSMELTLPQVVLFVVYELLNAGFEAYVVGGAVRDMLLQRETHDWDFTTNATPEEIQRVFPGSFYDNTYGTVGIPMDVVIQLMRHHGWKTDEWEKIEVWQKQVLEVTTYRTEFGYSDKRRPDTITWGKSITEDLSRRDFTLNALALTIPTQGPVTRRPDLNGMLAFAKKEVELHLQVALLDPFGGLDDIEAQVIRAVRDPYERFEEDALRMMRAIRFGAQLGFKIEVTTLKAIQDKAQLIAYISRERIRDELLKILASNYPADGVMMLKNSGLLDQIVPELKLTEGIRQGGHHIYDVWKHSLESLRECPSTDPIVRLATLLHDIGKPKAYREQGPRGVTFYGHEVVGARIAKQVGERLRLPRKDVDRLFILVRWHMFAYNPEMTDAAIRRFIRRVGLDNINDMLLLRVGDRKGGGSKATSWRLRELQERIGQQLYEPLSLKDLKINGTEIMNQLKLKPGPKVGKILNQLFEEVLDDSSLNTNDYLTKRAMELYKEI